MSNRVSFLLDLLITYEQKVLMLEETVKEHKEDFLGLKSEYDSYQEFANTELGKRDEEIKELEQEAWSSHGDYKRMLELNRELTGQFDELVAKHRELETKHERLKKLTYNNFVKKLTSSYPELLLNPESAKLTL